MNASMRTTLTIALAATAVAATLLATPLAAEGRPFEPSPTTKAVEAG